MLKIYNDFCSAMIDVGALEGHTLEQHEYIERARAYAQRLQTLSIPQVRIFVLIKLSEL